MSEIGGGENDRSCLALIFFSFLRVSLANVMTNQSHYLQKRDLKTKTNDLVASRLDVPLSLVLQKNNGPNFHKKAKL